MSSLSSLLDSVESVLLRHGVANKGICVGLSGGLDSVALLEILMRLREKRALKISAVHVHHGLSPNADQWASFCQSVCNAKAVPLTISKVAIDRSAPGGIESLARDARYAAFDRVEADFLALAQHADDQAETVLHQMLRGTGLKGMAGMGETRPLRADLLLIRPLLSIPRATIDAFAKEARLEWVEDESNADIAYTRNFIRAELAPKLAERFPHYRESLARTGNHAAEADEMLSALAKIDLKWDGHDAHAEALDGLSVTRQVNALYHWLQWLQRPDGRQVVLPSHAQLVEWAQQLFRPPPTDRPHQAGGHDFVIHRRKNLLRLERK